MTHVIETHKGVMPIIDLKEVQGAGLLAKAPKNAEGHAQGLANIGQYGQVVADDRHGIGLVLDQNVLDGRPDPALKLFHRLASGQLDLGVTCYPATQQFGVTLPHLFLFQALQITLV